LLYSGNPQAALVLRLIVALLMLALTRLLLYVFNTGLFPGLSLGDLTWFFFTGLRFDLSAVLYANLPVILLLLLPVRARQSGAYQTIVHFLYSIINSILLIPNLVDVIYYRFTMKRLTGDIFSYLNVGADTNLITQFLKDFWYIFLIWIACILLITWTSRKIRVSPCSRIQGFFWYFTGQFLLTLVFSGLTVLGMRGGFQLKPVGILTAADYAEAQDTPLVLNSAFTIMKTFDQKGLEKKTYFRDEKQLSAIFNPEQLYAKADSLGNPLPMKKMNVVVIILESFSSEHFRYFNPNAENGKYKGFTPFLDSLAQHTGCWNGFANGKRSIEGIPAIMGGLPTWMDQDFITSQYSGDKTNSLASLLRMEGYSTAFFHGGTNGTMGFNSYARSAGFERYAGRTEYGNDADYDGEWGIWDEPYLQYFAGEMGKMKQPFLTTVFTLSSHHPYKVPEKYRNKFRKGALPIQETVMYTDYALSEFFRTASKTGWYDNTLFVITADHTSEASMPVYKTRVGQYRIPVMLYCPGHPLPESDRQKTFQQTDIMPTVLDILDYPKPFIAFGSSIFSNDQPRFNLTRISNSYQLIQDDYVLQWNDNGNTGLFNFRQDPFLKNHLESKEPQRLTTMQNLLKALIQQYNNRIIDNRLTAR